MTLSPCVVFMQFLKTVVYSVTSKLHSILGWNLYCVFWYCLIVRDDEPMIYKDWKVQHWAKNSTLFNFDRSSGRLRITEGGVYYIYAQVLLLQYFCEFAIH